MIEIPTPRLPFDPRETPKRILEHDFPSVGVMPIAGGWGYSQEDCVVVEKNECNSPGGIPFDGVGLEYVFVEKRIYEELIVFRPTDQRYSGITWKLISQRLAEDGDRRFDWLSFDVTGVPDDDWEYLKQDWGTSAGFVDSTANFVEHQREKEQRTCTYKTDYWFEITSFYGQTGFFDRPNSD